MTLTTLPRHDDHGRQAAIRGCVYLCVKDNSNSLLGEGWADYNYRDSIVRGIDARLFTNEWI
jgi:hypothetical protein